MLWLFNVCNIFIPETYNGAFTFVSLFNVVNPLTFNDEITAVLLFNVVNPLTFNYDNNVELSFTNTILKNEYPLTFRLEYIVTSSFASIFCKPVEDNPQQSIWIYYILDYIYIKIIYLIFF